MALGLLTGALTLTSAAEGEYRPLRLDPAHSRIGFTASTLVFSVDGMFKNYDIVVDGDPRDYVRAKVQVNIDSASIFTANSTRDGHLSSPDFFDVKRYPRITFVSDRITKTGRGLEITGTLDMHGHRKQLTIPFQIAPNKEDTAGAAVVYTGRVTVNRNDWGVGSDSVAAKISLLDDVTLDLVISVLP